MRMLLLVVALSAPVAWADSFGGGGSGSGGGCTASCGVTLGVTAGVVFGLDLLIDIVDLVAVLPGGYIGPGWGILQGLWGLAQLAGGAVMTGFGILGSALQVENFGWVLAAGLGGVVQGVFLIVMAVVGGVRYVAHKRKEHEERMHPAVPVASLLLDPVKGTGGVALAWAF